MLLVVDNGSAYTKQLINFLLQKGISFVSLCWESIDLKKLDEFSSIILSGRKQNNSKMNALNSAIIKHCLNEHKPLLGICYGAEILALTLGGTIKRSSSPQRGTTTIDVKKPNPLCSGHISVFESHSFEISSLPKPFICIASSQNCRYEIVGMKDSSLYGTQFHPEMTQDGRDLLANFVKVSESNTIDSKIQGK